eukprot:10625469-Alexandrium_andersonii.AAC.1
MVDRARCPGTPCCPCARCPTSGRPPPREQCAGVASCGDPAAPAAERPLLQVWRRAARWRPCRRLRT